MHCCSSENDKINDVGFGHAPIVYLVPPSGVFTCGIGGLKHCFKLTMAGVDGITLPCT